jgi:predicted nucleic acid-binding protein
LSPKQWKRSPRGVIDTSVLVAGVAGFRSDPPRTPSAVLLRDWCESPTFVWLVTDEILEEYLDVLTRLNVRGARNIARLIGEEAVHVQATVQIRGLPHEEDAHFAECAESGRADFLVTLNKKHFPQDRLSAMVIAPTDPLPRQRRVRKRRATRLVAQRKK